MLPLPSLLQVLLNAELLSVKLCAYPLDTRAVAVAWFLTQGEVITLHLFNVSLTSVLTLVPFVLTQLPLIVTLPSGVQTFRHGVIHASVQLNCRSCPHKVIVMRTQALYILRSIVSTTPLKPPPHLDPN